MRSIWKLFLANLRHKKGAFAGIVILMAIVTFSYACTVSNNRNLRKAVTDDITHRNIGDFIFILSAEDPSEKLRNALDTHADVTDWKLERMLQPDEPVLADGKSSGMVEALCRWDSSYQVLNDALDGFQADSSGPQKGELYASYQLNHAEGFEIGKTVTVRARSGDEQFRIAGYYQETVWSGTDSGCCLLNPDDFDRICAEKADPLFADHRQLIARTNLHVYVREGTDYAAFRKAVGIDNESVGIALKSEIVDADMVFATTGTRLVAAFTALLLAVVMIALANSISSAIETDYVNLGVLKSQGFTTRHLRAVWLLQYAAALLLGSVIGLLTVIPAIAVLGKLFSNLSGILASNRIALAECGLYALGIFLLCTLFLMLATLRIGRISPVRAISGGKQEVYFDSRLNTRVRKKGLSFFMTLRQLTSRRKSYLGSMLIAALLVFFLCTVMVFSKGMGRDLFVYPTGDVELTMLGGNFKLSKEPELERIYKKYDADASAVLWTGRNMTINDEDAIVMLYTREETFDEPLRGRKPKYDNEIMLTEALCERLHKDIGDSVTVKYMGKSADYVITGLFQTLMTPAMADMTFGAGAGIGIEAPDLGYIAMQDTSERAALIDELNETLGDLLSAKEIERDAYIKSILSLIDLLMAIILSAVFVISVIFSAVVVTMVCQKAFLRERTDIGILRAVGFSVGGLRLQYALRFLLIAVLGSVLGCVCSACCSMKLLSQMLRFLGITRFQAPVTPAVYLLPALAICAAFFLVAWLSSRRIRTVSVRELVSE